VLGREVVLVSSADETAFAVRELMAPSMLTSDTLGEHRFFTSGDVATFRTLGARFLGPEVRHVHHHAW
jgi:glutamate racemase